MAGSSEKKRGIVLQYRAYQASCLAARTPVPIDDFTKNYYKPVV